MLTVANGPCTWLSWHPLDGCLGCNYFLGVVWSLGAFLSLNTQTEPWCNFCLSGGSTDCVVSRTPRGPHGWTSPRALMTTRSAMRACGLCCVSGAEDLVGGWDRGASLTPSVPEFPPLMMSLLQMATAPPFTPCVISSLFSWQEGLSCWTAMAHKLIADHFWFCCGCPLLAKPPVLICIK